MGGWGFFLIQFATSVLASLAIIEVKVCNSQIYRQIFETVYEWVGFFLIKFATSQLASLEGDKTMFAC